MVSLPGAVQVRVTLLWATCEAVSPVGAASGSSLTRALTVAVHGPLQGPSSFPPLVYRVRAWTLKVAPLVSPVRVIDVAFPLGYAFSLLASLVAL